MTILTVNPVRRGNAVVAVRGGPIPTQRAAIIPTTTPPLEISLQRVAAASTEGDPIPVAIGTAAPYAAEGPIVAGTSKTPNSIDTVIDKSFLIEEFNRSFFPGTRLRATAKGFEDVWLEGIVTAWDGQTVTLNGDLASGVGVYSDWLINVAGEPGINGVPGAPGPPGPAGGPVGPAGPQGPPGSVWRNGTGAPNNSLGVDGDYYLDDTTNNVWLRSAPSHTYAVVANLGGTTGATGPEGPQGDQGTIGPQGPQGSVWRTGNGAPSSALGVNGDYYLDDLTDDVYAKSGGAYAIVANIHGNQGAQGIQGPQGIVPEPANDGNVYGRRVSGGVGSWQIPPGGGDVASTRTLTAGTGLTGGGTLAADRTFNVGAGTGITVNADDVALTIPVAVTSGGTGAITAAAARTSLAVPPTTRALTAGAGLTGGGDLSADRTFDVGAGTGITVAADAVGLTIPVAITSGGTGAITAAAALTALGAAPLNAPIFTGDARLTTSPTAGDSDTSIATTGFVAAAVAAGGGTSSLTSCQMDPYRKAAALVLSNNNLTVTHPTANTWLTAWSEPTNEIWPWVYYEMKIEAFPTNSSIHVGFTTHLMNPQIGYETYYLGQDNGGWSWGWTAGASTSGWYHATTYYGVNTLPFMAVGDVLALALDRNTGWLWVRNVTANSAWNGTYAAGGDPTTGVGKLDYNTYFRNVPVHAAVSLHYIGASVTFNFDGPMVGTVPARYRGWRGKLI